jgi:primosomal protein N' (replication factor Y)
LALIGPRGGLLPRPGKRAPGRTPAPVEPVAQVLLESPLRRLDRPFDYLVSQDLDARIRLGVKVRVRFGRQRLEGWVVGRTGRADHTGALRWIDAVVGPEPVFTADGLALIRRVAEHYAGTTADVMRLAIPPRHASAAKPAAGGGQSALLPPERTLLPTLAAEPGHWVWTCPPGQDWAAWFAGTLADAADSGRSGLAVVPDGRDLRRVVALLRDRIAVPGLAVLSGHDTPAARYTAFRDALEGRARIVVGTRSAAFAPLPAPDLLLLWDDGDDSHSERRAPYPHAREVLAMRAAATTALVVGGYARTTNTQRWLAIGWAQELPAPRRDVAPRVRATMDEHGHDTPQQRAARLPASAGATIRSALADGPVLVAVGRPGYVPRLRCAECGTPADCRHCGGPLAIDDSGAAGCARCGRAASDWRCPTCQGNRFRSSSVGSDRTAEELGRAFPNVPVIVSAADRVRDAVPGDPALVIATPGAEPVAEGGYAAVVVLDMAAALAQPGLRSAEQAAHRWFSAGALARPRAPLVLVGDPAWPVVQALIRWDPGWFAERELRGRQQAGMPPARRAVSVQGRPEDLREVPSVLPPSAAVLGPVRDGDTERLLVTVPPRDGAILVQQLRAWLTRRSAEGAPALRVRVDPPDVD